MIRLYPLKNMTLHLCQVANVSPKWLSATYKRNGTSLSMSRRGNCLDNAPIESIFGHFKDEVDYKQSKSLAELHTRVREYMDHYNHTKAMGIKKIALATYRSHLIAA